MVTVPDWAGPKLAAIHRTFGANWFRWVDAHHHWYVDARMPGPEELVELHELGLLDRHTPPGRRPYLYRVNETARQWAARQAVPAP